MNTSNRVDLLYQLSDPTRMRILLLLANGERFASDIAAAMGTSVSLISNHLLYLRDAKLLTARREGFRVFYRLAQEPGDEGAVLRFEQGGMNVALFDAQRSNRRRP